MSMKENSEKTPDEEEIEDDPTMDGRLMFVGYNQSDGTPRYRRNPYYDNDR